MSLLPPLEAERGAPEFSGNQSRGLYTDQRSERLLESGDSTSLLVDEQQLPRPRGCPQLTGSHARVHRSEMKWLARSITRKHRVPLDHHMAETRSDIHLCQSSSQGLARHRARAWKTSGLCIFLLVSRWVFKAIILDFPGFPGGSVVKKPPANLGFLGEGNGNPLRYPCLGDPMDRGLLSKVHGVTKSWTWLCDWTTAAGLCLQCGPSTPPQTLPLLLSPTWWLL